MANQNLSKSFEDYLERVYILKKDKGNARVKDIAKSLGVSLPSVTMAIKKLAKINLIDYERYGLVKLTKKGEEIAKDVYKKHRILFEFFTKILKVNKKTALRDACIMEHGLSKSTLNKLIKFVNLQKS